MRNNAIQTVRSHRESRPTGQPPAEAASAAPSRDHDRRTRTILTVGAPAIFTAIFTAVVMSTAQPTHARPATATTIPISAPTSVTVPESEAPTEPELSQDEMSRDEVSRVTVPFTVAPEFEPEYGEVTNCIGSFAERPGCGASGRGGWRQSLVFVLLVASLAFIAWRIIAGARRSSVRQPDAERPSHVTLPNNDPSHSTERSNT